MLKINKNSLKEARKNSKMTLHDVAKEAGVSHSTIHGYENGRQPTSEAVIKRIASALKVPLEAIIGREEAAKHLERRIDRRRFVVLGNSTEARPDVV
jgi:transcriptional regulator with XRE-family HTH domain